MTQRTVSIVQFFKITKHCVFVRLFVNAYAGDDGLYISIFNSNFTVAALKHHKDLDLRIANLCPKHSHGIFQT